MMAFHFSRGPNSWKVALLLEEAGLEYDPVPVDIRKGEQFRPELLELNPNGKVPVIEDGETVVFDSNAILLHLSERTGRFGAAEGQRGELLSWLLFVASGVSPFAGQAVHFRHYAADVAYGLRRYTFEARRHFGILDARLADRPFILGGDYCIVDMAAWGPARVAPYITGDDWEAFPNLRRWVEQINARRAAGRVEALMQRHLFKNETDADAAFHLFPHNREPGGP